METKSSVFDLKSRYSTPTFRVDQCARTCPSAWVRLRTIDTAVDDVHRRVETNHRENIVAWHNLSKAASCLYDHRNCCRKYRVDCHQFESTRNHACEFTKKGDDQNSIRTFIYLAKYLNLNRTLLPLSSSPHLNSAVR